MNNQNPDFIGQHAIDLNDAQLFQANNQPIPQELAQRIQTTQQLAAQNLSHGQMQDALRLLNAARLDDSQQRMLHEQEVDAALTHAEVQRELPGISHDLSADGKGLNFSQMESALHTGTYDQYNAPKAILKAFDGVKNDLKAKYGRSWKAIEGDLDELFMVGPDQVDKRAAELNIDPVDAHAWRENAIEMGLKEKRLAGAEKEEWVETVELSPDQDRKMDVIAASLIESDEDITGSNTTQFEEDLEDDSRHGDLARAFQQEEGDRVIEAATA